MKNKMVTNFCKISSSYITVIALICVVIIATVIVVIIIIVNVDILFCFQILVATA